MLNVSALLDFTMRSMQLATFFTMYITIYIRIRTFDVCIHRPGRYSCFFSMTSQDGVTA
ncbi:hypothetical protein BCV70DRAFT_109820 [Testicularia cyperi]|uniref:Uncharacterized protein n=1 Tax=Testicularia cyperi TaxID=1882483 RepID=A0A317XNB8_9BASI|nr:hypothetical protein BCV70DRAFT_109820 [Testicularia cyperi]